VVTPIAHIFRWDLDKTYLRTEFDTLGDLVKAAMETAVDKQAFPGSTALLRALGQGEGNRICIISGSPTQMRKVLAAKLALDGVRYDEFVLKNNLRNLLRGRFRALRSQVPYKLPVLLESRAALDATAPETLFGDDAESDAIIYSLFADILAGKIPGDELRRILQAARAYDDEIDRTLAAAERVLPHDAVGRILIHLDQRSPTARFTRFGPRLVPIFNYFQAALVLYSDGILTARQVLFVALEMLDSPEYELSTLANSLQDLLRRGRITRETAIRLALEAKEVADTGALAGRTDLPPFDQIAWAFAVRVQQLGAAAPFEWPGGTGSGVGTGQLDYVSLVDGEFQRRRQGKQQRFTLSSW
jgi:hypothetical protein